MTGIKPCEVARACSIHSFLRTHSGQVGAMNVYDIALDFVLLDAFDDLENPPSAFVSVLKNTWITNGMKKSVGYHKCFVWVVTLYNQYSMLFAGSLCCFVVHSESKEKYSPCKCHCAIGHFIIFITVSLSPQHKNGFMSRFYVLSETITPPLAWGFLGTDAELNRKCVEFKVHTLFCVS